MGFVKYGLMTASVLNLIFAGVLLSKGSLPLAITSTILGLIGVAILPYIWMRDE